MAENTQTQVVRIGDKFYDASKLTDRAVALFNDIEKVDGEIGRLQLQTSIANVARTTLINDLVAETANLGDAEVPAPEGFEAPKA